MTTLQTTTPVSSPQCKFDLSKSPIFREGKTTYNPCRRFKEVSDSAVLKNTNESLFRMEVINSYLRNKTKGNIENVLSSTTISGLQKDPLWEGYDSFDDWLLQEHPIRRYTTEEAIAKWGNIKTPLKKTKVLTFVQSKSAVNPNQQIAIQLQKLDQLYHLTKKGERLRRIQKLRAKRLMRKSFRNARNKEAFSLELRNKFENLETQWDLRWCDDKVASVPLKTYYVPKARKAARKPKIIARIQPYPRPKAVRDLQLAQRLRERIRLAENARKWAGCIEKVVSKAITDCFFFIGDRIQQSVNNNEAPLTQDLPPVNYSNEPPTPARHFTQMDDGMDETVPSNNTYKAKCGCYLKVVMKNVACQNSNHNPNTNCRLSMEKLKIQDQSPTPSKQFEDVKFDDLSHQQGFINTLKDFYIPRKDILESINKPKIAKSQQINYTSYLRPDVEDGMVTAIVLQDHAFVYCHCCAFAMLRDSPTCNDHFSTKKHLSAEKSGVLHEFDVNSIWECEPCKTSGLKSEWKPHIMSAKHLKRLETLGLKNKPQPYEIVRLPKNVALPSPRKHSTQMFAADTKNAFKKVGNAADVIASTVPQLSDSIQNAAMSMDEAAQGIEQSSQVMRTMFDQVQRTFGSVESLAQNLFSSKEKTMKKLDIAKTMIQVSSFIISLIRMIQHSDVVGAIAVVVSALTSIELASYEKCYAIACDFAQFILSHFRSNDEEPPRYEVVEVDSQHETQAASDEQHHNIINVIWSLSKHLAFGASDSQVMSDVKRVKYLSNLTTLIKSGETIVSFITRHITSIYKYVTEDEILSASQYKSFIDDITKWITLVSRITAGGGIVESCKNPQAIKPLTTIRELGESYQAALLHLERQRFPGAGIVLAAIRKPLIDITRMQDNAMRLKYVVKSRPEPICLVLSGAAGIGKSQMLSAFGMNVLRKSGTQHTPMTPGTDFMGANAYCLNPDCEHFDGYRNQPLFVMDEWCPIKDDEMVTKFLNCFMRIVNSSPYHPSMAELEEKKTTQINSPFIFVTSNEPIYIPNANQIAASYPYKFMSHPQALVRRLHYRYMVVLDPAFRVDPNNVSSKLDIAKVMDAGRAHDMSIYKFYPYTEGTRIDLNAELRDRPFDTFDQVVDKIIESYGLTLKSHFHNIKKMADYAISLPQEASLEETIAREVFGEDYKSALRTNFMPIAELPHYGRMELNHEIRRQYELKHVTQAKSYDDILKEQQEFAEQFQMKTPRLSDPVNYCMDATQALHRAVRHEAIPQQIKDLFEYTKQNTGISTPHFRKMWENLVETYPVIALAVEDVLNDDFKENLPTIITKYIDRQASDERIANMQKRSILEKVEFWLMEHKTLAKIVPIISGITLAMGTWALTSKYISPFRRGNPNNLFFNKKTPDDGIWWMPVDEEARKRGDDQEYPWGIMHENWPNFPRSGRFYQGRKPHPKARWIPSFGQDSKDEVWEQRATRLFDPSVENGWEGESKAYMNDQTRKFTSHKNIQRHLKPNHVTQALSDPQCMAIGTKIAKNCATLKIFVMGRKYEAKGIFLFGQTFLLNKHILSVLFNHTNIWKNGGGDFQIVVESAHSAPISVHPSQVRMICDDHNDIALIRFKGNDVYPRCDIRKYLPSDINEALNFAPRRFLMVVCDLVRERDRITGHEIPYMKETNIICDIIKDRQDGSWFQHERPVTCTELGKDITNSYTFKYVAPTSKGMCGAPLILNDVSVQRKFVGIHSSGTGNDEGGALILDKQYLDQLVSEMERAIPHESQMLYPRDVGAEQAIPFFMPNEQNMKEGKTFDYHDIEKINIVGINPSHLTFRQPDKSEVRRSLLWGLFPTAKDIPNFSPTPERNDLRSGVLKHYTCEPKCSATEAQIEMAVNDVKLSIDALESPYQPKVLTLHEAINGIPGSVIKSVEMSTSAGFPLNSWYHKTGKKHLFEGEIGHLTLIPEIQEEYDALFEQVSEGIIPYAPFTCTLKDEKQKPQKEVRTFYAGPMLLNILGKQFFGSFIAHLQHNCVQGESMSGINVNSVQWDQLFHRLTAHGRINAIAGDFKNFDCSLWYSLLMWVFEVMNHFYRNEIDHEQMTIIRRAIFLATIRAFGVVGTIVLLFQWGNTSGNWGTVIINNIAQMIMFRLAWLCLTRHDLTVFSMAVAIALMGDDHLACVHPNYNEFNQQTLQILFNSWGIEYTDAQKNKIIAKPYEEWKDVTLLKGKFHMMDDGRYHYRICMETLQDMVMFIRSKGTPEECLLQNLKAASELMAAGYNKFEYLQFFEKIQIWIQSKTCMKAWRIPSYEDARAIYEDPDGPIQQLVPMVMISQGRHMAQMKSSKITFPRIPEQDQQPQGFYVENVVNNAEAGLVDALTNLTIQVSQIKDILNNLVGGKVNHVVVDNFPSTQNITGSVQVSNFPNQAPISGTVAVSNWPPVYPLPLNSKIAVINGEDPLNVQVGNFPTKYLLDPNSNSSVRVTNSVNVESIHDPVITTVTSWDAGSLPITSDKDLGVDVKNWDAGVIQNYTVNWPDTYLINNQSQMTVDVGNSIIVHQIDNPVTVKGSVDTGIPVITGPNNVPYVPIGTDLYVIGGDGKHYVPVVATWNHAFDKSGLFKSNKPVKRWVAPVNPIEASGQNTLRLAKKGIVRPRPNSMSDLYVTQAGDQHYTQMMGSTSAADIGAGSVGGATSTTGMQRDVLADEGEQQGTQLLTDIQADLVLEGKLMPPPMQQGMPIDTTHIGMEAFGSTPTPYFNVAISTDPAFSAGMCFQRFLPLEMLMQNTIIRKKLDNYALLHYEDLELEIFVQATKFHYGRFMAVWIPYSRDTPDNVFTCTMYPHVELELTGNTMTSFKIPYFWPEDWMRLQDFNNTKMNPLRPPNSDEWTSYLGVSKGLKMPPNGAPHYLYPSAGQVIFVMLAPLQSTAGATAPVQIFVSMRLNGIKVTGNTDYSFIDAVGASVKDYILQAPVLIDPGTTTNMFNIYGLAGCFEEGTSTTFRTEGNVASGVLNGLKTGANALKDAATIVTAGRIVGSTGPFISSLADSALTGIAEVAPFVPLIAARRPPVPHPAIKVRSLKLPNATLPFHVLNKWAEVANLSTISTASSIALYRGNHVQRPEHIESMHFSGELDEIVSSPSLLSIFHVTDQLTATNVWKWHVHPGNCPALVGSQKGVAYKIENNLSYVASFFEYWRGDIKLTFKFIASPFQTCKLRWWYRPVDCHVSSTDIQVDNSWQFDPMFTADMITTGYMRNGYIDISGEKDVDIMIPYCREVPFLRMLEDSCSRRTNGTFGIDVITTQVSPDAANPPIEVLVYVSGHEFQWQRPRLTSLSSIPRGFDLTGSTAQFSIPPQESYSEQKSVVTQAAVSGEVLFGETITNLYDLGKRPTAACEFALNPGLSMQYSFFATPKLYLNQAPDTVQFYNYLGESQSPIPSLGISAPSLYASYQHHIVRLFAGMRGSMIYRTMPMPTDGIYIQAGGDSDGLRVNNCQMVVPPIARLDGSNGLLGTTTLGAPEVNTRYLLQGAIPVGPRQIQRILGDGMAYKPVNVPSQPHDAIKPFYTNQYFYFVPQIVMSGKRVLAYTFQTSEGFPGVNLSAPQKTTGILTVEFPEDFSLYLRLAPPPCVVAIPLFSSNKLAIESFDTGTATWKNETGPFFSDILKAAS